MCTYYLLIRAFVHIRLNTVVSSSCQDECSFVSLRDVDRVLSVMSWFCSQAAKTRTLYDEMDKDLYGEDERIAIDNEDEEEEEKDQIPRENRVGLHSKGLNLPLTIGLV